MDEAVRPLRVRPLRQVQSTINQGDLQYLQKEDDQVPAGKTAAIAGEHQMMAWFVGIVFSLILSAFMIRGEFKKQDLIPAFVAVGSMMVLVWSIVCNVFGWLPWN